MTLPFVLGEPVSSWNLTIVPLYPLHAPKLEYLGLDGAAVDGLTVGELDDDGSVGTLLVSNPLEVNVLVYDGEELVGAKQNRILDRTVLVPPASRVAVPVTCVERGRWSYTTLDLVPASHVVSPRLKSARNRGGQSAAWDCVDELQASIPAPSPTSAVGDYFRHRGFEIDQYVEAFPVAPGQCGAAVAISGRIHALDFVSRPDVFAGLYPKLLRGYAFDALDLSGGFDSRLADGMPPKTEQFLEGLIGGRRDTLASVGLGTSSMIRDLVGSGSELRYGDELVALGMEAACF